MRFLRGFGRGEVVIALLIAALFIVLFVARHINNQWFGASVPDQTGETSEIDQ